MIKPAFNYVRRIPEVSETLKHARETFGPTLRDFSGGVLNGSYVNPDLRAMLSSFPPHKERPLVID